MSKTAFWMGFLGLFLAQSLRLHAATYAKEELIVSAIRQILENAPTGTSVDVTVIKDVARQGVEPIDDYFSRTLWQRRRGRIKYEGRNFEGISIVRQNGVKTHLSEQPLGEHQSEVKPLGEADRLRLLEKIAKLVDRGSSGDRKLKVEIQLPTSERLFAGFGGDAPSPVFLDEERITWEAVPPRIYAKAESPHLVIRVIYAPRTLDILSGKRERRYTVSSPTNDPPPGTATEKDQDRPISVVVSYHLDPRSENLTDAKWSFNTTELRAGKDDTRFLRIGRNSLEQGTQSHDVFGHAEEERVRHKIPSKEIPSTGYYAVESFRSGRTWETTNQKWFIDRLTTFLGILPIGTSIDAQFEGQWIHGRNDHHKVIVNGKAQEPSKLLPDETDLTMFGDAHEALAQFVYESQDPTLQVFLRRGEYRLTTAESTHNGKEVLVSSDGAIYSSFVFKETNRSKAKRVLPLLNWRDLVRLKEVGDNAVYTVRDGTQPNSPLQYTFMLKPSEANLRSWDQILVDDTGVYQKTGKLKENGSEYNPYHKRGERKGWKLISHEKDPGARKKELMKFRKKK